MKKSGQFLFLLLWGEGGRRPDEGVLVSLSFSSLF